MVLSSHHPRKVRVSQEWIAELIGWAGFEVLTDHLTLCPVSSHTAEVAGRLCHPKSSSIWLLYTALDRGGEVGGGGGDDPVCLLSQP